MDYTPQLFIEAVLDVAGVLTLKRFSDLNGRWSRSADWLLRHRSEWNLLLEVEGDSLKCTFHNTCKDKVQFMALAEFRQTDRRLHRIGGVDMDFGLAALVNHHTSWTEIKTPMEADSLVTTVLQARLDYSSLPYITVGALHAKTKAHELMLTRLMGNVKWAFVKLKYWNDDCLTFVREQIDAGNIMELILVDEWPQEITGDLRNLLPQQQLQLVENYDGSLVIDLEDFEQVIEDYMVSSTHRPLEVIQFEGTVLRNGMQLEEHGTTCYETDGEFRHAVLETSFNKLSIEFHGREPEPDDETACRTCLKKYASGHNQS